jgi:hypothetical protein
MPSIGSTSPFGEVDRRWKRNRFIAIGPSTPFAHLADRPSQGSRSAASPLSRQARRHECRPLNETDASCQSSAADLLSRVPRATPRSQAPGLSPLQPPRLHHVSRRLGDLPSTSLQTHWRWLAIAGISSLGWPMGWRPTDQPEPYHHPISGCPVSRAKSPSALSANREPGESTLAHPLSPLKLTTGIPVPRPMARIRFLTLNHERSSTNPRCRPPTSPASATRALTRAPSTGRHQYPGFAAKGLASDTLSRLHPKRR